MGKELEYYLDEAKATGEDSVAADATAPAGGADKKRSKDKSGNDAPGNIGTTVKTPQGTNNVGLKEVHDFEELDEALVSSVKDFDGEDSKEKAVDHLRGLHKALTKSGYTAKNTDHLSPRAYHSHPAVYTHPSKPTKEIHTNHMNVGNSMQSSSVKMMSKVKSKLPEGVDRLFDGADLTEEFKDKTIAIFEAAVHERVLEEKAMLEEQFENDLQEQIDVAVEELVEKVDAYLDYVVENWMDDNKVQIESNIKVEVAESLLAGIKGLVTEHSMEIDDEQINVVAALEAELEESNSKYNELVEQLIESRELQQKSEMEIAFKGISEQLTDTQAEKLRVLSEGVSFETVDEYSKKLIAIRDNYFTETTTVANDETDLLQEEVAAEAKAPISLENPMISRYADALARFAAK